MQRNDVPLAIYSDRHGIFFKTKSRELSLEEQLDGRRQPTQFARLLDELGIQLILARSPQAKGRVERLWGTFRDRLASEPVAAGLLPLDLVVLCAPADAHLELRFIDPVALKVELLSFARQYTDELDGGPDCFIAIAGPFRHDHQVAA